MKLHVKECTGCRKISVRIDGDTEWCQWRQGGFVPQIKAVHEVLSHDQIHCPECQVKTTTHIALTAGSVT